MKIAALYDIHGNLPALDAVLEELQEVQPDLIVVGGDMMPGPLSRQTLERLVGFGKRVRFLHGNGDREVVTIFDGQPLKRRYLPGPADKGLMELRWVAQQFTQAQRDFLAALPEQFVLQADGLGNILFCHATPRDDEEIFTPATPEARLRSIFASVTQEIVVCGHTHMQFELEVGGLRILNAGSVGMPFADQPGAYWLLLNSHGYEFRRTLYDREAAARIMEASGNPLAHAFVQENVLSLPSPIEMTKTLESWTR
jgi:putative phosphoesterase